MINFDFHNSKNRKRCWKCLSHEDRCLFSSLITISLSISRVSYVGMHTKMKHSWNNIDLIRYLFISKCFRKLILHISVWVRHKLILNNKDMVYVFKNMATKNTSTCYMTHRTRAEKNKTHLTCESWSSGTI